MCIKLNFYLIVLAVYFYAVHKLNVFVNFYTFALLHEIAHIVVATVLKIHIEEILLMPIGVCAKYSYIESKIKEILIAASRAAI